MSEFKRGLQPDALEKIGVFLKSGVGHEIIKNENCLICIRNNYINVYYHGCSLLRYKPLAPEKQFLIHHEYLPQQNKDKKKPYISLKFDFHDLKDGEGKSFIEDVMRKPSESLKRYTGKKGEKRAIADYLREEKQLGVDLEVAFERKRDKAELIGKIRPKIADKIDLAIINGDGMLQLLEVKMDYDSRLKSKEDGRQKVLIQMKHYQEFIEGKEKVILESYKTVVQNYIALTLFKKLSHDSETETERRLKQFLVNPRVDKKPCLLIIETGANMKGRYVNHMETLAHQFRDLGYPEIISYKSS